MKQILFTLLLLLGATTLYAQKLPITSAEEREAMYKAEMKEKLAIDYSMPDYTTNKFDANVMGEHMAMMVNTFLEKCTLKSYQRPLNKIIGEQVEALQYSDYGIKKMNLVSATKSGNEITLLFRVWLDKNTKGIKQTEMTIRFIDGVSDSKTTNELFRNISSYAMAMMKDRANYVNYE